MKIGLFAALQHRRKGVALITVLGVLALITILMLAMFSTSETEFRSTQKYNSAQSAKQLADAAVAIVQAQIQNGQNSTTGATRTTHSTQPGAVRVYSATGSFSKLLKLYSSSTMVETSSDTDETAVVNNALPPQAWDSAANAARYVDMNAPVVRAPLAAMPGGQPSIYFPIIDPRAAHNYMGAAGAKPTTEVEGFSYSNAPLTASGAGTINGVVMPGGTNPDLMRVPMPVEWIYMLQDGSFGTLDASNNFVPAIPSRNPTLENPIVGRIAFWTDDESSKINVNTASEPTFTGPIYYYHERNRRWAHFPALAGEYQRYPGHPATVALSAVLAPGYLLDPTPTTPGGTVNLEGMNVSDVVSIKEQIYGLAPKISAGGSMGGTKSYVKDDFDPANIVATPIDISATGSERLYASVDEMLFREGYDSVTNQRPASELTLPGAGGKKIFDRETLERSRFFLTAQSRAPEFSIHGLPRIAVWPIADETKGKERRTNFDNLIALCATLRSTQAGPSVANSYFFRRASSSSQFYDVTGSLAGMPSSQGLARNSDLLNYLEKQMSSLSFPRTSETNSTMSNFVAKYGADNVRQLAVEFFDYVRMTNLYDGILARFNNGMTGNGQSGETLYTRTDTVRDAAASNAAGGYNTFTESRIQPSAVSGGDQTRSDDTGVLPGHGQVAPAVWQKNGKEYMGFGRMLTISEFGLHVICTADGANDDFSVNYNGKISGGKSAVRLKELAKDSATALEKLSDLYSDLNIPNNSAADYKNQVRWYSNFPPLTGTPPFNGIFDKYGVKANAPDVPVAPNEFHPSKHPGFRPEFWNLSLEPNKPLETDEKRVQAMISIETFCPALGWTKFYPEFTLVLNAEFIREILIDGQPLFQNTLDQTLKSNSNIYEQDNTYTVGGHAPPRTLYGGRRTRAINSNGMMMPSDPSYVSDPSGPTRYHTELSNMNFVSDFITVKRDKPLKITFPQRPLQIDVWNTHDLQNPQKAPIQRIKINFDGETVETPTPELAGADAGISSGLFYQEANDGSGRIKYTRAQQGPRWWSFSWAGVVDRYQKSSPNRLYPLTPNFWNVNPQLQAEAYLTSPAHQIVRGRLDTDGNLASGTPANSYAAGIGIIAPSPYNNYDVMRTVIPADGDYRIVAANRSPDASLWKRHSMWGNTDLRSAHNFTSFHGSYESGYKVAKDPSNPLPLAADGSPTYTTRSVNNSLQLVAGINYPDSLQPDIPGTVESATTANSFGDFDAGIGNAREGAYINKPDEGNYFAGSFTRNNITKYYRSGYFYESWRQTDDWRTGIFMTPNRMISSPVMFGSLPTGVWPGMTVPGSKGINPGVSHPWQTLLFRPYVKNVTTAKDIHPGARNPRDHYLLDLFFMPVVEPYAISEPLSQAGKINLNYQILPFTHIKRATGLHALMKGELLTAIPNTEINNNYTAKGFKAATFTATAGDTYWADSDGKYWHRPIDVDKTLLQFQERFKGQSASTNQKGLFRSASQICEVFLVPKTGLAANDPLAAGYFAGATSESQRKTLMQNFWQNHAATGENVRERPYSNLYPRVTTRSNTFRVHVRSQVIKKARSTAPGAFDVAKDAVLSEYRGSTLIERFIDPTDVNNPLPDYAASSDPLNEPPLDTFYQFRVLESKRFAP